MLTPEIATSELASIGATASLLTTEMAAGEVWRFATEVACYIRQGDPAELVVADKVFTATNGTETFTSAGHGLQTGDGPIQVAIRHCRRVSPRQRTTG